MNITQEGYAPQLAGQAHHWFREVLLRQYGGVPYNDDNTEVLWGSPEGCEAFAWLASFEVEHLTGSNDLFTGATEAFITGTAALHIDGSFRLGTIARNNPELNYGVAELPVGPNGEQHTFGSYWTHGITRRAGADEARMEAATRFLQFITTAEAGAPLGQHGRRIACAARIGRRPHAAGRRPSGPLRRRSGVRARDLLRR